MAITTARKVYGYSDISEAALSAGLVTRSVANTEIEKNPATGQIGVYVHATGSSGTYTPGTGKTATADASSWVQLTNLTEVAVNEVLDGYTLESAPMDYAQKRLEAGVIDLLEDIDTATMTTMISGGTELYAAAIATTSASTIVARILAMSAALTTAKAPRQGRSLIITPAMETALLSTDSKITLNTESGYKNLADGFIGRFGGFDIYVSPLVPSGTNMIALQTRGFAYGDFYTREPRIQSLDGSGTYIGDVAVQARMAYNYGVIRATFIQCDNSAA